MQLSEGYNDVPAGKLPNVVTCLEMRERPALRPEAADISCTLERIISPEPEWYRTIFRRIGEPYLWFSRLVLPDEQLLAAIRDPEIEIYTVNCDAEDQGLLELDFRRAGECELLYFGLSQEMLGNGTGRWLMNRAIELAWSHPIERFWVHTCSLDHPGAVAFYVRSGFTPYKRQIEYADDPRLTGALPRGAAPHIPLI